MNVGACAVQSHDLILGLDVLREFEAEHGFRFLCANLLDESGAAVFPAYHVYEFGDKKLGVLAVTETRLQHALREMPKDLSFKDPAAFMVEGVKDLREKEGCDAVVLLYGGRREHALQNCKELAGVDLIFFGNASISQRVAVETDAGTPVYAAANRGKDLGEIVLTIKDEGGVELSPILIHELDKQYDEDPEIKELVNTFKAEADERKQRAKLIEDLAKQFSEAEVSDTYLGTELCARCHQAEYDSFLGTGHAKAMASLEADFQEINPECVACHVTGWQQAGGYGLDKRNRDMLRHVQCEACHGYGTAHERGRGIGQAEAEAMCLRCHDAKNSPDFDYATYWEKIKH